MTVNDARRKPPRSVNVGLRRGPDTLRVTVGDVWRRRKDHEPFEVVDVQPAYVAVKSRDREGARRTWVTTARFDKLYEPIPAGVAVEGEA